MLLIAVWEALAERNLVRKKHPSPIIQFFRHVRNAAAHNGKFKFQNGDPILPAEWGSFVIRRKLQDTFLFKEKGRSGLILRGDLLPFLIEVQWAIWLPQQIEYPEANK